MSAKRKRDRKRPGPQRETGPAARRSDSLRARRAPDDEGWELVHPRCAHDSEADVEEVRKMIDAGEIEVAREELRWLLGGCSDFLDAHRLLGELALLDGDMPLARGHFGYAYQIGARAMRGGPPQAVFPYRLPANEQFYEAGKGLVWSLKQLGKTDLAQEVVEQLLKFDPSDPLGVRELLAQTLDGDPCGNEPPGEREGPSAGAPSASETSAETREARPRRKQL